MEVKMNNKDDLKLYIPKLEELDFYQSLLADPETMSYNAPWFPPDGCIDFPKKLWEDWHKNWIDQEPDRFYAYLQRTSDGAFIGDVNFHYNKSDDWWDMGIVILASERGKGYGKKGLKLLLDRAFKVSKVHTLHNSFDKTRNAAYRAHKSVGFNEIEKEDGYFHLIITREDYLNLSDSLS